MSHSIVSIRPASVASSGVMGAAAALLMIPCLLSTPASGGGLCFSPTPYPVGVQPSCVIMADLNGDTFRDLAIANHDILLDNRISILLNNGDGTFAPGVFYDAGDRPYWIASGDLDGDTDLDLAVSNYFDTTVSLYINHGDGSFDPQVTVEAGTQPGFVALANLDGDADLDLICTNIGDDTVSILMGNGDGTFVRQVTYPVGPGPYGVVAANLDGDAWLDLAFCNHHADTVSIILNLGDGTFGPMTSYTVEEGPVGIDAADLDGDGAIDLVCANTSGFANGTTLSVLENNGNGTFGVQPPMGVPPGPYTIKIADFNADGWGDLACANESGTASIFLNNGDGTFAAPANFVVGANPVGLDVGDLDGNATPEVAVTCYEADEVWVLFNEYAGIIQQPDPVTVALGAPASFTVSPGGPGPFTYQWRKDSVPLVDGGTVSGSTTATLDISSVTARDQGVYDVTVTNDCGPVDSDGAILTVITCPADIAPIGAPNGVVNVDDLLAVINGWGPCGDPENCPADISPIAAPLGNDVVNVDDLLAVINGWGPCP